MAVLYLLSALGCAFAWNWSALVFSVFSWSGIGGSGSLLHIGKLIGQMARLDGGTSFNLWC
jgi:hypothetical protein